MRHRSPSLEESYHLIVDGATAAAPQTRAGSTRGEGTPDECVEASFFASPHAPVSGGSFRVHRSSSAISSDHRADNERGERGARVPLLSDADDREGDVPPHLTRLHWYQFLLLLVIDMLGPFSSDSFIPNMPEIQNELSASQLETGLTLQLNWILKSIGNIVLGHLSDLFGRKPVIFASFFIYVVSTTGCALSPTMHWLIFFRMTQGFAEGNAVVASAIARDVYEDDVERMRIMGILGALRPLAIITSPMVGGLLGALIGWRNVCLGLAGIGVVSVVLIAFLLPETCARARGRATSSQQEKYGYTPNGDGDAEGHEGQDMRICSTAPRVLSDPRFLALVIPNSLAFCSISILLTFASYLYEGFYGFSVSVCGLLMGVPPMAGFIGAFASIALSARIRALTQYRVYQIMAVALGVAGLALGLVLRDSISFIVFGIFCGVNAANLFFGSPAYMTMLLTPHRDISGLVAGLARAVQTAFFSSAPVILTVAVNPKAPGALMIAMGGAVLGGGLLFLSFAGWWTEEDFGVGPVGEEETLDAGDDAEVADI